MGISPNNNISPLPFFDSISERNPWYSYGNDAPLMCPKGKILPILIQRPKREETARGTKITNYTEEIGYYLKPDGTYGNEEASIVATLDLTGMSSIYIDSIPAPQSDGVSFLYTDEDGQVVYYEQLPWIGIVEVPEGATTLKFQLWKLDPGYYASVYTTIQQIRTIESLTLYRRNGTIINTLPQIQFSYRNDGDVDTISSQLYDTSLTDVGEVYLDAFDGVSHFYSALFCLSPCDKLVKITWYDNQNLSFDSGVIPYSSGFKNVIFIDTDIALPTYEFEDEVEERDGYQFPLKQISYKKYRFSFIATEQVCDVMRLIRLSDNIIIEKEGKTYNATSFLMTPSWQEQGYLASVECEFTTDTVVKKIGRAYTQN